MQESTYVQPERCKGSYICAARLFDPSVIKRNKHLSAEEEEDEETCSYFLWIKTIKSEFSGAAHQLFSASSGSRAGGEVGVKKNPLVSKQQHPPPLPSLLLQHVRNLCPPPAPGKFP